MNAALVAGVLCTVHSARGDWVGYIRSSPDRTDVLHKVAVVDPLETGLAVGVAYLVSWRALGTAPGADAGPEVAA